MKGILVCCDGEKSLKKELSLSKKKQAKNQHYSLISHLKILLGKPNTKLEIVRR